MIFEIGWIEIALGMIGISFIQGIGFAAATAFFQRKFEKHFQLIEEKLKTLALESEKLKETRTEEVIQRRQRFKKRLTAIGVLNEEKSKKEATKVKR